MRIAWSAAMISASTVLCETAVFLLTLRVERVEGVGSVEREEDTRGDSQRLAIACEVGVREQPELELVGVVSNEANLSPGRRTVDVLNQMVKLLVT